MMKLNASNAVKLFVVASPIDINAPDIHSNNTNGRRFTRSPSGEMSSKAVA